MAGRVLGWLLICDDDRQSFQQIVEVLQASKGSISTMTRLLIQLGLIDRVTLPGDRRDYFQLCPDAWTRFLRQRVQAIGRFRELAERGLPMLRRETPRRRARLQGMYDLYSWWESEANAMLERWEARSPQQTNGSTKPRQRGTTHRSRPAQAVSRAVKPSARSARGSAPSPRSRANRRPRPAH